MGMYDQSWCSSCGAGMLYTEDENVTCYRCDQEEYNKLETRSSKFLEYMKIHLISLNQDLEADYNVQSKINIQGQIMATEHLLSVANDIMNETNERYDNE
jgi:hypothetical protein